MTLKRNHFFLLLAVLALSPAIIVKLVWIFSAHTAHAKMAFAGKEISGQLVKNYSVMFFSTTGKDTVFFNTGDQELYEPGQVLPILYQPDEPTDARVNRFWSIWLDTVVIAGVLAVILLIVFFHPEIIPYRCKVRLLRSKPYIRFIEK
ncbi:MAG: DUF3592 domain-containing protein [Agriterribacter sp.]